MVRLRIHAIVVFFLLACIGRTEANSVQSSHPLVTRVAASTLVLVENFKTKPGMASMDTWKEVDLSRWTPQNANELMGLFRSLFGGYTEFGGARTMSIDINMAPDKTYEVFIKQEGFKDDSVAGERWAAKVKHGENGWYIDKIWRQQTCYRGVYAGTWTKGRCL